MTTIQTYRLLLRPARQDDLGPLFSIFSKPEAMRYWSTLPHANLARTAILLKAIMKLPPNEGQKFIVELDGQVIGKSGFWRLTETGFIYDPKYWGQGLASEAFSAVLDYGFQVQGLKTITADVDPRNDQSIALLNRHGFVETHRDENTFKLGDEWCGSIYFALGAPSD